jgi:hypothetical protein
MAFLLLLLLWGVVPKYATHPTRKRGTRAQETALHDDEGAAFWEYPESWMTSCKARIFDYRML